jgi:transposase InsO family protein
MATAIESHRTNGSMASCGMILNGEIFDTLWEAKVLTETWRREYNQVRSHSALGYNPPAPEAVYKVPV